MATKNRRKGWIKKASIFLVVLLAIGLLFSFDGSASWLADKINQPVDVVKKVVKTIVLVTLGLFLISTGAASLAVPIIGGALIVIGIALVAYGLYPWFKKDRDAVDVQPE